MLLGNYNGAPSDTVTPLRGIREAVSGKTKVIYARGTNLVDGLLGRDSTSSDLLEAAAEKAARASDAVVLVLGLTNRLEGEEMRVQVDGFRGGDRTTIDLPASQERLLERIVATGKPTVLVLVNGSALAINWAAEHVPAIVEAWYPGEAGGSALADVHFGDYNPAGRLPVTFYRSADDLPPFDDYSMVGRTYRFFDGPPLYPFGHGLSYTTFAYDSLRTSADTLVAGGSITVRVNVTNTGKRAGDEVVQLYVQHLASAVPRPRQDLRGFKRVTLAAGRDPHRGIPACRRVAGILEHGDARLDVRGEADPDRGRGVVRRYQVDAGGEVGVVTKVTARRPRRRLRRLRAAARTRCFAVAEPRLSAATPGQEYPHPERSEGPQGSTRHQHLRSLDCVPATRVLRSG